jgi:hypothetical protein
VSVNPCRLSRPNRVSRRPSSTSAHRSRRSHGCAGRDGGHRLAHLRLSSPNGVRAGPSGRADRPGARSAYRPEPAARLPARPVLPTGRRGAVVSPAAGSRGAVRATALPHRAPRSVPRRHGGARRGTAHRTRRGSSCTCRTPIHRGTWSRRC